MANDERNSLLFFFFSYSVNYRRIYTMHLKGSRFVEDVLFYLKNLLAALKMRLSQRCSSGNLILTILSCENPSNI